MTMKDIKEEEEETCEWKIEKGKNKWDMVNCSNCDCSKNLLDTILLLLDTVRAIIFFLVNCQMRVEQSQFEQFTPTQINQCAI
jgi:hypothetical protein